MFLIYLLQYKTVVSLVPSLVLMCLFTDQTSQVLPCDKQYLQKEGFHPKMSSTIMNGNAGMSHFAVQSSNVTATNL